MSYTEKAVTIKAYELVDLYADYDTLKKQRLKYE